MLLATDDAVEHVKKIARRHDVEPVVRVRVIGGGCAGLACDLSLGEVGERDGDRKRITDDVTVIVDGASSQYLRGAILDVGRLTHNGLREPIEGAKASTGLVVSGITAKELCECGQSFAPPR